jgi:tetratricopeptide (TPR) repeat protein
MAKKSKSPTKQIQKKSPLTSKETKQIPTKVDDELKQDLNDPDLPKLKEAISYKVNHLYASARDTLQDILKRRPGWKPAIRELVEIHMETRNFIDCEKVLFDESIKSPKDVWTWTAIAKLYKLTNNPKAEMETLKKLNEIAFNEVLTIRLFDLQRDVNDLKGALETLLSLRSHQDSLDLEIAHAKLLYLDDKQDEALKMADKLLGISPIPKGAIDLWVAQHLSKTNNPEAIVHKLLPMIEGGSEDPELYAAVGRAYHRMEILENAVKFMTQALEKNPKNHHWWYDLSLMQRQQGLGEEAQNNLKKCLELESLNPIALRIFSAEHKYEYGDEFLKKLNFAHACIGQFTDDKKVELYHALAKAYEDLGELNTAFKFYEIAGEIQGKLTPYHHTSSASTLKMTRDRVTPKTFTDFKFPRCESDKPVFVLGMPRSGTTLAEQIIASHPEAYGAGELKLLHRALDGISINKRVIETSSNQGTLPTYIPGIEIPSCRTMQFEERGELYVKAIEAIAKGAGRGDVKRIVDKMPGNYFWAGVIPYILPNAKIIHTARHPLDNCLSLYRLFFPDGMPWSYELANLGKVSRAYFEHMDYWEKNLPANMMLTVPYEIVVADFENQAKKIIKHVGLPWDEACLRFYETERNVKTASLTQVRKPIYNTSVGRWRKYEAYLQPLIKELGPIIKNYENMISEKLEEINKP